MDVRNTNYQFTELDILFTDEKTVSFDKVIGRICIAPHENYVAATMIIPGALQEITKIWNWDKIKEIEGDFKVIKEGFPHQKR